MVCRMVGLVGLVAVIGCSSPAAPPPPHPTEHAEAVSQAPATRTALLEGLGRYHRPIATSNADAQRFFDEGLTLLYGFNHEEAFRSFEHAAQLDPKTPMPHWGMALALGTNINDVAPVDRLKQAYTHLAEAQEIGRAHV